MNELTDSLPSADATDQRRYRWSNPRLFTLTVVGDSMRDDQGEISFEEGDILYVDPDLEARHRNIVIVRTHDDSCATFKQLLIEPDGRKILRALNPSWPNRAFEMPGNAQIVGVVVAKFCDVD